LSSSVGTSVSEKQAELQANPPTIDTPTGMTPKDGPPKERESGEGGDKEKTEKVAEGEAVPVEELEPTPEAPPSPVDDVAAPQLNESAEGEMSEEEAEQMGSAVEDMPATADEVSTDAGPPPTLALEGDADPQQMTDQREAVDEKVSAAHAEAAGETSIPMGEDEIAPQPDGGTTTAEVSGGAGGAAGGGAGGGEASPDEETASIVAQEEKQAELDAAADKGAEDMGAEEESHQEETEAEKQRTMEEAAKADQQSGADQQAQKSAAQSYVSKKRGQWRDTQTEAVETSQTDAQKEETEAGEEVETERENADTKAGEEIEAGERDAKKEKSTKESEAETEKAKAKEESSGFFGWLASKAKAFFNKIKAAIKSIMSALRKAVKALIEAAKKAALAVIEAARKAAVAAIRAAGDAIIAIGDVALAAFPEAREKFRGYINEKVADAEDAVNEFADDLKAGVEALFDALGEFLDKALQLLEKAMLAVVDAYAAAVDAVIKAAEAIAKAFGMFMVLIKDIASGPGAWISNLGAAVVDGIKNHLVQAMKDAISAWFKGKVEEVLGLPVEFFQALFKGGIDMGAIAKIAWSALKSAIPAILIQLLIEKLVSMVVPAAGAVLAIIEGLQAAWGTVSKILAAIDKFITFLKAVKGGGAGPQFAQAVAAGAVAVIDFVANWLLQRLMKPAKKVSGKLAAMAKKIMAKLKKGLKKVGKKLKKAFKSAKKKVKGLFKKKGKGKKKGGKKKDGEKDDKKKKDAENRKKLKRAMKAFKAKLRAGAVPGPRGKALASEAASKEQAQATLNPAGDRWRVEFSINPKISAFVPSASAKRAAKTAKKAGVTLKSIEAKLTQMWRTASAAHQQAGASKRKADEAAKQEVQQQISDAGGLPKFIRKDEIKTDLKAPQSASASGEAFEKAATEATKQRALAAGEIVGNAPKRSNEGGLDVGSVAPPKESGVRPVTVTEIKSGDVRAMSQESSKRGTSGDKIPLDPAPSTKRGDGSESTRHLRKNPHHATALATGSSLAKTRDGKEVVFESKVSAIVNNLIDNLETLAKELRAAKALVPEGMADKANELDEAARAVDGVRTNQGGELKIVIAHLKGAPEGEIEALDVLLTDVKNRLLNKVQITRIIQKLDAAGNLVGEPREKKI
jgi:hypothetical protein